MLFRIAEQLRHVSRPQAFLGLYGYRRAAFSFCGSTSIAHTRPADDDPTPQNTHNADEGAQLKAEKREKKAEYMRGWYRKKREDPVYMEQRRIRNGKSVNRHILRKKSESELSKHTFLDVHNEATRRWLQKIYNDDASKQEYMVKRRISLAKGYAASYDVRRRRNILNWFWQNKEHLDTFIWKRWRPICLPESVKKVCATCRSRSKHGNRRLWFVRKSDPAMWDCMSCFCSSDLSDVVPIQGAERFYNAKYLQPQSTGVEDIDRQADTQESVVRKEDEVKVHEREDVTVKEEQRGDHKPQQP